MRDRCGEIGRAAYVAAAGVGREGGRVGRADVRRAGEREYHCASYLLAFAQSRDFGSKGEIDAERVGTKARLQHS